MLRRLTFALLLSLALGCSDDAPPGEPIVDASLPQDAGIDAAVRRDAGVNPFHQGPPPAEGLCNGMDTTNDPFPAPDAWSNHGPGGPVADFTQEELYQNCAELSGGEGDREHHNLLTMYDGYLLMPWAPEWGNGGLTLWDISNPCAPVFRGRGTSETMRETHALGFSQHAGGNWTVVNSISQILVRGAGGIEFWNLDDTSAPRPVSVLNVPGFVYPDAYARVTLSVFWQAPYVYVGAGENGVFIADASDPENPVLLAQHTFDPVFRVGQVQAIGNLLVVTAAEGARTVLLDISDPADPLPIPGGDFLAEDAEGTPREAYFTNVAGGRIYYARKDGGAGIMIYDITDPEHPVREGGILADGGGGYVFVKDNFAFEGAGKTEGGYIFDITDPEAIETVAQVFLPGDLDTLTPIGNVVVLSVDAAEERGMDPDVGSAIAPWQEAPDTQAPRVTWSWPNEGATGLDPLSRIGLTFNEFIDAKSAFEGSVRLRETESGLRVPAIVSTQEVMVNVHPRCPLSPNTEYTLEVPTGGIADFNGNTTEEVFELHFRTGR